MKLNITQQRLLLVSLLSTLLLDHVGATWILQERQHDSSRTTAARLLAVPESVEAIGTTLSNYTEDELTCEPHGTCNNCAGSDRDTVAECLATGRKQAYRCWATVGEEYKI